LKVLFCALKEHAEKLALIAGYGKHLLELLDDSAVTPGETRPAYDGYEDSKQIIVDCENALMDWTHAVPRSSHLFRPDDETDSQTDP